MLSWWEKLNKKDKSPSPDCSGYPTTSAGKSLGVRSNRGKRDQTPKK